MEFHLIKLALLYGSEVPPESQSSPEQLTQLCVNYVLATFCKYWYAISGSVTCPDKYSCGFKHNKWQLSNDKLVACVFMARVFPSFPVRAKCVKGQVAVGLFWCIKQSIIVIKSREPAMHAHHVCSCMHPAWAGTHACGKSLISMTNLKLLKSD